MKEYVEKAMTFAEYIKLIDDLLAPGCAPEPLLRPIQVPRPATTRTAAASTAIQRGCRYHRGPCGPAGDGGAPAG